MRILIGILSGLRGQVPIFVALGFSMLGLLAWKEFRIDIQVALIGGAIIGYIVGIVIRRFIPDPEEKAL